jgi:hypothetical protein
MSSNSQPTVAVIANFDPQGDPDYKAWCFACSEYLLGDKRWSSRTGASNAANKHLEKQHGTADPEYQPAAGRPSDVKVGEVSGVES